MVNKNFEEVKTSTPFRSQGRGVNIFHPQKANSGFLAIFAHEHACQSQQFLKLAVQEFRSQLLDASTCLEGNLEKTNWGKRAQSVFSQIGTIHMIRPKSRTLTELALLSLARSWLYQALL